MGCCCDCFRDPETAIIDKGIQRKKKKDAQIKKLLLLGAGGSGKSTIYNQLTILHGDGITEEDCKSYRRSVHNNILDAMQMLIRKSRELHEEDPTLGTSIRQDSRHSADFVATYSGPMNATLARHISILWRDSGIRRTFLLRSKFHLEDQCKFYFENIDRISRTGYIPTLDDVLRVRCETTGIKEQEFTMQKTRFKVVDVGGQRNERRKWMHCFSGVTGVIFVCALSGYDQVIVENNLDGSKTNRMHESLNLFQETTNSRWFTDSAVILFLNKTDLFEEKIGSEPKSNPGEPIKVPLQVCFPNCPKHIRDPYREGIDYIREQFKSRAKANIHIHETCATDTRKVEKVFQDVQHQVIKLALQRAALLGPDMI